MDSKATRQQGQQHANQGDEGGRGRTSAGEGAPIVDEGEELTVVPMPRSETEQEHRRIRSSNDRDQKMEREGKPSRHNQGYDEVADLKRPGQPDRPEEP